MSTATQDSHISMNALKQLASPQNTPSDSLKNTASAFAERVMRVIAKRSQDIGQEALLKALSQDSDEDALLEFTRAIVLEKTVVDTSPLLAAKYRGIVMKSRLIKESGGALNATKAAQILGISRQAVEKRISKGQLLAVKIDGVRMLPAFQFQDTDVISGWQKVLEAFTIDDAWMQVSFMLSQNPGLQGKRPVDVLKDGDKESVIRTARAYGEQGAS